ncbi:MAG: methylamine utilization protein [Planctomycetia bacterium]|nr:methylamine utilization protein [Planctomycetia bacterium]
MPACIPFRLPRAAASALAVIACGAAPAFAEEWGSVKGRFEFGGQPVAAAELKADKDVDVCGKHKLLAEELVVGADKGLANVVVFVRDKGIKVHPDLAAAKSEKVVLDNQGCRFQPHVAVVQTGQPFVIKNSDTVGHNSNIATLKNPPSNSLIPQASESPITFNSEEAIPSQVTCNIHPWMKAWVVIRGNPYVAVSKPDGTFELRNLPAGEVELQFWHEKAGYIGEMTVGGKAEKIAKGRKKVRVAAGDNDLGTMVLDANLFNK